MAKPKSLTHYTEVHFHAPVGQYIDYVENQTVAFDKDMQMHIAQVGNTTATPEQNHKEYCIYICREKLQEQGIYTIDEFESMMANASKGIASDFAAFLKRYKEQGILNFMEHSKRKIFDYFRAHYPEMRKYDYPNFAAAF